LGIAVPVQSIFYDPWGLSMKGMQISRNPTSINKHQFLGAETQAETGYIDLQNRQYDPQRGQMTSPDALAELSRRWSPFSYSYNNPIRFSDPDGLYPGDGDTYTTKDNNGNDVYNDVNSQKVVGYGGKSEAADDEKDKGKKTSAKNEKNTTTPSNNGGGISPTATTAGSSTLDPPSIVGLGSALGRVGSFLGASAGVAFGFVFMVFGLKGDTHHIGDIAIPDVGIKNKEAEYITLYRGVSQGAGVYYAAALRGIAVPKGLSFMYSHSNPDDHTSGDNYSIWTSWSSDKNVANYFSGGPMGVDRGVILEKKFLKSLIIRSNLSVLMQEGEWLVPGVVTGANVTPNKK
jgi:RHS repeat-associated protein